MIIELKKNNFVSSLLIPALTFFSFSSNSSSSVLETFLSFSNNPQLSENEDVNEGFYFKNNVGFNNYVIVGAHPPVAVIENSDNFRGRPIFFSSTPSIDYQNSTNDQSEVLQKLLTKYGTKDFKYIKKDFVDWVYEIPYFGRTPDFENSNNQIIEKTYFSSEGAPLYAESFAFNEPISEEWREKLGLKDAKDSFHTYTDENGSKISVYTSINNGHKN